MFIAVALSPEIRDTLEDVIQRLRPCCESGRFTKAENLHLTLTFLGEVSAAKAELAREAMDAVSVFPFPLHVGGFGYFRRQSGDIFWAGVERSEPLSFLHRQLSSQLRSRGFSLERRGFRPHLTLARQAALKQEYDHGAFVVPAAKMLVEKITLFQSERPGGKLCYTPVYEKMLSQEKTR
ncbi:MAG: RNA 2',3'-cyclic phosphodiesterase [Oscillospiraceae bacterium]|nr:RNA 2',3'-cyclic phosphodiesterase [Oscillospiraceae bacterium]